MTNDSGSPYSLRSFEPAPPPPPDAKPVPRQYSVPRLPACKGDGETWEDYARRLEIRIKQQRDGLKELVALRGEVGDKKARRRIANLERILGQKEAKLDHLASAVRALRARVEELVEGQ